MAITDTLTRWQTQLITPVSSHAPLYQRILLRTSRVIFATGRDIAAGTLTLHAMSLVYTTLLSVVPLLALSFSVLKALGVHNELEPLLFQFFSPLGPQGVQLAEQILGFVDNMKVGVLGSVGLATLVYTVVSLIQKIERSFNMIWQVSRMRSLPERFSSYLSVILIGPILMVAAIGVTASIMNSSVVQYLIGVEPLGTLIIELAQFTPFLLVMVAFSFVYAFMPNTRVKFIPALMAGVIAGLIWQTVGMLFANFVVQSSKYEAVYSSFAIGIVMLIWIYTSWLILLIGATLSYYIQHEGTITLRRDARSSALLDEQLALRTLVLAARPFDRGETLLTQAQIEEQLGVPIPLSRRICEKLIRAKLLICNEGSDQLLPGRSIDQISLSDILTAIRNDEDGLLAHLPVIEGLDASPETSLASVIRQ
ncbi:tRNA-processing ribonuclease BN [gamma proteobacterium HdN1]|nr:tRNA-processing ribonuclease BN [gamma proteobacterium HdN1]